jgi:type II secretory pathway pseudopilin PulG
VISPQDLFTQAKAACNGDETARTCIAKAKKDYLLQHDAAMVRTCSKYSEPKLSECMDWHYLNGYDTSYSHLRFELKYPKPNDWDRRAPAPRDEAKLKKAEAQYAAAEGMIRTARTAKGPSLLSALEEAEQAMRNAANFFAQGGDDDRGDAALTEAARLHMIRFIEGNDGNTSVRDCESIARDFDNIDKENTQSVKLVAQVKGICEPIIAASVKP